MSLLTDTSIRRLLTTDKKMWEQNAEIQKNKLLIANYSEDSLTPVGYDLRVGDYYLKMHRKVKEAWTPLPNNAKLIISPGEIVALQTEEFIGMPQNKQYSGIIVAKVSLVEMGLSHISTSIDADYKGEMIITVTNHSKRKITLRRKQPICTMILFKNELPATKLCGKDPNRHVTSLLRSWGALAKKPLKSKLLDFIKICICAAPLVYLSYKYLTMGVSEAEVVLLATVSSAFTMAFFGERLKY
jgi:deoxycytidine triphosphate deaminase